MITIYGMPTCPDCAYLDSQIEGKDNFTVINIGETPANLKAFLKIRETSPVFADAKANGSVGIPCLVLEDGTVTLNPADAGLTPRPAEEEVTSCCGEKGC